MLTQSQINEMKEVARPLVEWMRVNASPHDMMIVDCRSAELVNGAAMVRFSLECDPDD